VRVVLSQGGVVESRQAGHTGDDWQPHSEFVIIRKTLHPCGEDPNKKDPLTITGRVARQRHEGGEVAYENMPAPLTLRSSSVPTFGINASHPRSERPVKWRRAVPQGTKRTVGTRYWRMRL
jgi:hypothetical protein